MAIALHVPEMFRALRSRNYRLFFTGQTLSLIGTWMTRIATSWLIYKLTGSALLLGTVGFAGQIPTFLLAPVAGVFVDRWDRYRIMVTTQTLSMLQSFALAFLAITGRITVAEVLILSICQGLINAFDTPARQSFMIRMVDRKEHLSNAIALNSSMVNSARLIGPSIAGILIAVVGTGWCFFWDGVSYIAVIVSLLMMRIERDKVASTGATLNDVAKEFADGWRYVTTFHSVRDILILLALVSLMGMPYTVLLPIFATRILHGGPQTLGWLMSAVGVGALIGAFTLAARKSVRGLGRVLVSAAAIFGIGLIGFSLSHLFWLSLILLTVTGYGFIAGLASCNTLIQTVVEDSKRGRVMSFYTMAVFGTVPLGSLIAGVAASRFGPQATLFGGGACCALGAVWFATRLREIRRELSPIYQQLGILGPPADVPVELDGMAVPVKEPEPEKTIA